MKVRDRRWDRLVEAEYRLGRVAHIAEEAVRLGNEHRDHPDALYVQAKRYLASLVGYARGRTDVPPRQKNDRIDLEIAYAGALALPAPPVGEADEAWLRSAGAYQDACSYLYYQLCEIYDRRFRVAQSR